MAMRALAATCTAAAIVVASAVAVPSARAQDDTKTIDQSVMDMVMRGIGLEHEKPAIEYRERAPLVIPPSKALPPPETADAAASNPAWPKDPDVIRRREAARLASQRNISEEREREQNPLRPDQMTPGSGRGPRIDAQRDDGYRAPASGFASPMKPSELGYTGSLLSTMFGGGSEKPKSFTGEPHRTDLTEPPPGYQTPSPDQPYGPGKAGPAKATDDYLTRGELKR